jgi:hypothetical protein
MAFRLELVEKPIEGWRILQRAIPSEHIKAIASRYGVTADHLRRWMREPLSDEAPLASGQRSPVDRTFDLMDAIHLSHPTGVAFIREAVCSHHDQLVESTEEWFAPWNRREHAATALRETVEAVNCLNLDVCDEETLAQLVEAADAIGVAISRLRTRRPSGQGDTEGHQETPEPAGTRGTEPAPREDVA